jgi:hypothetical protein
MHSYQRAGRFHDAAVASAYHLRERARLILKSNRAADSDRSKAFAEAAVAFKDCADQADKGRGKQRRVLYKTAAECFVSAGDQERAANAYMDAFEYTSAARHYRNAGKFDRVVDVIQTHKKEVDQDVETRLRDVSKMYFFKVAFLCHGLACAETNKQFLSRKTKSSEYNSFILVEIAMTSV